jgi:hypothetical protein
MLATEQAGIKKTAVWGQPRQKVTEIPPQLENARHGGTPVTPGMQEA